MAVNSGRAEHMGAYEVIRERLERGDTVVLDGAMGTELVRRGVRWRGHGMRTDSHAVQALHEEYLAAGAHLIRTNTFQLNRRVFLNVFHDEDHMRHIGAPGLERRAVDLTQRAVELARAARQRSGRAEVAIAGLMSPLEHCFRPDLAPSDERAYAEHREIASLLAEGGVDLLLLESMNSLAETRVALRAARETGLPVWVSFVIGVDGNVLSGESLAEAARLARALGAEAVLVNCGPPEDVGLAIESLARSVDGPVGGYAHIGRFDPPSWKFEFFPQFSQTENWPPARYAETALGWRERGARVLGGCCGTGPEHTRALVAALAGVR